MAYVRWSSKVRKDCAHCGDTGRIALEPTDEHYKILGGKRLCSHCTSCWYVYASDGDVIAVHHSGCDGCEAEVNLRLSYEDAPAWRPPAECPMGDIALAAVAEAVAEELADRAAEGGAR